jgi:hypothetical protein
MRRLVDPTQLPSLVIRSLPRSCERFVICCLCPTLEDEVRLSARLDEDRAEVRQGDDDLSTLHAHVKPNGSRFHAGAATLLTALQANHHLMLILTLGLRPFVSLALALLVLALLGWYSGYAKEAKGELRCEGAGGCCHQC